MEKSCSFVFGMGRSGAFLIFDWILLLEKRIGLILFYLNLDFFEKNLTYC